MKSLAVNFLIPTIEKKPTKLKKKTKKIQKKKECFQMILNFPKKEIEYEEKFQEIDLDDFNPTEGNPLIFFF
jgi:hypothetical protein